MRVSPHLVRAPVEPPDEPVAQFYTRLLAVLRLPILRNGSWSLLECQPAWHEQPDVGQLHRLLLERVGD